MDDTVLTALLCAAVCSSYCEKKLRNARVANTL